MAGRIAEMVTNLCKLHHTFCLAKLPKAGDSEIRVFDTS
jgi:hypothetical protein